MQPKFIEERRVLLERYLRALASHPTIMNSDELRVFLESEGKLAESAAWSQLHGINPSLAQGTSKFFRQITGRVITQSQVRLVISTVGKTYA